jgi:hypothetical protein
LYASSERDFGEKAASEAKKLKDEMEAYLIKYL